MKNLLLILIGIILIIGISATTVSVMTVKPAQPKNVVAFSSNTFNDDGKLVVEKIKSYSALGYILKGMTSDKYMTIVVMEKY